MALIKYRAHIYKQIYTYIYIYVCVCMYADVVWYGMVWYGMVLYCIVCNMYMYIYIMYMDTSATHQVREFTSGACMHAWAITFALTHECCSAVHCNSFRTSHTYKLELACWAHECKLTSAGSQQHLANL